MKVSNNSKIQQVQDNLTILELKDGKTRVIWKDSAPESLRKEWQEFTGNYGDYSFADLDEYYRVLKDLVDHISGYDDFTENDLYNIEWEDIAHADKLDWLKENLSRAYLYDEVKDNGADDLYSIIGDMQDRSRGDLAGAIYYNFLGGVDNE